MRPSGLILGIVGTALSLLRLVFVVLFAFGGMLGIDEFPPVSPTCRCPDVRTC